MADGPRVWLSGGHSRSSEPEGGRKRGAHKSTALKSEARQLTGVQLELIVRLHDMVGELLHQEGVHLDTTGAALQETGQQANAGHLLCPGDTARRQRNAIHQEERPFVVGSQCLTQIVSEGEAHEEGEVGPSPPLPSQEGVAAMLTDSFSGDLTHAFRQ